MLLSQISLRELRNLAAETGAAGKEISAHGQLPPANASVNQRNLFLLQQQIITICPYS